MKKARFIAGAICPQCGAEDRIVADDEVIKCILCDFKEVRPGTDTTEAETKPLHFQDAANPKAKPKGS